ncbi:unnamed protein product [Psylliodes chrysocephalus]|uniref:NACHT domain-containing protein n=1 Tax=Psylliodes chrysocephalus TaxID=3402493 RepID=A0A9P0GKG1_9CUCU|nr:unnamed protein product [Psylliodes chrysocephala]
MDKATYPKLKGSAGSHGVVYQVKLLQFYLLQSKHKDEDFKLSTENTDAAKFDDVVYETEKATILLQSKHFQTQNQISFDNLFPKKSETEQSSKPKGDFQQNSNDSKDGGSFNLFKYLKEFQNINKDNFISDNIQNVIICTNCEFLLQRINRSLCNKMNIKNNENFEFLTEQFSIFSIRNSKCYSFNTKNQHILVEYISKNVHDISEVVVRLFLDKLLLVSIFDKDLDYQIQYLIEQMNIKDEYISVKLIQSSIFDKMKIWFESPPKGTYLRKTNIIEYISHIKCTNYINRKIKALSVLLDNTANKDDTYFNLFKNNLILIKIVNNKTYDLHEFKICQLLLEYFISKNKPKEANKANKANKHELLDKMLFVDPHAPSNIVKNIINSFEVPEYTCLIVPIFDNFQKFSDIKSELGNAIEKNKSYKKIIIIISDILDEKNKLYEFFQNFTPIESNIKLSDFSANIQNTVLQTDIKFQGNEIPLQNVIEMKNEVVKWDNIIDENTLLKLAIGKEKLIVNDFKNYEELPFYVKRNFFKIDKQKFTEYFEYSNQWVDSIRHNTESDEKDFCSKVISQCNKFIAIFDSPGMGKSTILNRLAYLLRKTTHWILKINLNECTNILYKLSNEKRESVTLDELLDLLDYPKKTKFEENLFNIPKNVILLVDALDEICPEYSNLILNSLISTASSKNIKKIVLTSRPHVLTKLEHKNIECDMYALKQFSVEERITFLANFWCKKLNKQHDETKLDKIKKFANKLHGTLMSNKGWYKVQSLIGIPLQIKMIGDIFTVQCNHFLENFESHIELPEEFNLNWLYKEFINRQKQIYIDEKCNASGITATIKVLDKSFNEAINDYKREAIKLEFLPKIHRYFEILSSSKSCDEDDLLKMGILIKSNKILYFAHRTLSEYFATLHICELILENKLSKAFLRFLITGSKFLKNNSFIYHMLVDHSIPEQILLCIFYSTDSLKNCVGQNLIRLFIRKLGYEKLFRSLPLIELERVHEMLETNLGIDNYLEILNDLENVNLRTINNITPLHLACKYNSIEIMDLLITKGLSVKVLDGYGRSPLYYAVKRNKDILEFLFKKGHPVDIMDNFGATPLHYAVQSSSNTIIDFLLNNRDPTEVRDNVGRTPLHYAVQSGNKKAIDFLLSKGLSVEIKDNIGRTPLHYAVRIDNYRIIKVLLNEGHSLEIRDNFGRTPLHYAVLSNNKKTNDFLNINFLIEVLLENGHPLHITDYAGRTPLHYAAILNYNEIVKFLLNKEHSIDIIDIFGKTPLHYQNESCFNDTEDFLLEKIYYVDIPDENGKTPLHYKIELNQNDTVNLSINEGLPSYIGDVYGRTQLHFAAKFGRTDFIQSLLNKGYPVGIRDEAGKTPLHYALESKQDYYTIEFLLKKKHPVEINDEDGVTPLHIAAKFCKTEILDLLINKGHSIDSRDMIEKTPLHYALESEQDDTVDFLLNTGHPVDICDRNGVTPLHMAVKYGKTKIVDVLLNKVHNIDINNKDGATLLHVAAKFGKTDIIDLFLEKGLSIDIRDWMKKTPLHYALESEQDGTVDFLLNKGHPFDISDENGVTPLHIAARFGKTKIVDLLLNKGHSVEIGDKNGITPLHIATRFGYVEIIDLLLNKGHTVDIADNNGLTPLHIATRFNKTEVITLLLKKGHSTDSLDIYANTPFDYARESNQNNNVLDFLLNEGDTFVGSLDLDRNIPFNYGYTVFLS